MAVGVFVFGSPYDFVRTINAYICMKKNQDSRLVKISGGKSPWWRVSLGFAAIFAGPFTLGISAVAAFA
ncbi:MAG: hypothetical protein ACK4LB_04350 [Spirosomataceae bacterium]